MPRDEKDQRGRSRASVLRTAACRRSIESRELSSGGVMDLGLKGRGVIVAASSQGIRPAAPEAFARERAQVAMCARTEAPLREAADKIRQETRAEVLAQTLDVTDPD